MIASWMVYALLVGVLVSGAALGLESALRPTGLPVRWVWAGALALTVALVGVAPRRVPPPLPELRGEQTTAVVDAAPIPVAAASAPDRLATLRALRTGAEGRLRDLLALADSRAPAGLGRWLVGAWGAASLLALLALAATHTRYRRLRRGWPAAEVDGLRVRVAPTTGPAVVGLHRPEIVLPRWLLELPADERRLVLAHEQEHVRARDPLLLAAGCAAAALLPWHPASWWMLSRLRLAVEFDCDARVLRRGLDRRSYGTLLIDLAGRSSGSRIGMPALADEPTHLERRLLAMTSRTTRFAAARALAVGSLSGIALLVACEAKLPTAEDVAEMDVSGVEALIAGSQALGTKTPRTITYYLDGREVTAEQARAVAPERIHGISMQAAHGAGDEMVVMISSDKERQAMRTRAVAEIDRGIGEAVVLIDGRRADLAAYRALDPRKIDNVAVFKEREQAIARYGPAAAGGLIAVTTKGQPRRRIGGSGIARLDGGPVTRAEIREVLSRPAVAPSVYLIDGARADRAKLLAIPEGEVWSIMIAQDPAFEVLYGAGAAMGIIQVKTKTGSAREYARFVMPNAASRSAAR